MTRRSSHSNSAHANRVTPIIVAAQEGHLGVVEALLAAGANVNHQGVRRLTALNLAAQNRHVAVVDALLEAGAHLNVQLTPSGHTPLHMAAQNGHLAVLTKLLDAGADIDVTCSTGETALQTAQLGSHPRGGAVARSRRAGPCPVGGEHGGGAFGGAFCANVWALRWQRAPRRGAGHVA